jgi:hypothetical protein
MKARKKKPYWEMTTEELAEATRQYDAPMPGLPGKPLTAKDRALHARANRKPGRPRIGAGVKVISLTMERNLLKEADAYTRQAGLTRSQFFARAVRSMLAGAA